MQVQGSAVLTLFIENLLIFMLIRGKIRERHTAFGKSVANFRSLKLSFIESFSTYFHIYIFPSTVLLLFFVYIFPDEVY